MPFFFGGFGFLFFFFGLALLGLVALVVVVALGGRGAPDAKGRRPYAVYLLAVMFVTLFTAAGAVAEIGGVLVREAVGDGTDVEPPLGAVARPVAAGPEEPVTVGAEKEVTLVAPAESGGGVAETAGAAGAQVAPPPPPPPPPPGFGEFGAAPDRTAADLLRALLLGGLAAGVFEFHRRRFASLVGKEGTDG